MKSCKPCIRFREIVRLAKTHFKAFLQDVRDTKRVNAYACEIETNKSLRTPMFETSEVRNVRKVREQAMKRFNPKKASRWKTETEAKVSLANEKLQDS